MKRLPLWAQPSALKISSIEPSRSSQSPAGIGIFRGSGKQAFAITASYTKLPARQAKQMLAVIGNSQTYGETVEFIPPVEGFSNGEMINEEFASVIEFEPAGTRNAFFNGFPRNETFDSPADWNQGGGLVSFDLSGEIGPNAIESIIIKSTETVEPGQLYRNINHSIYPAGGYHSFFAYVREAESPDLMMIIRDNTLGGVPGVDDSLYLNYTFADDSIVMNGPAESFSGSVKLDDGWVYLWCHMESSNWENGDEMTFTIYNRSGNQSYLPASVEVGYIGHCEYDPAAGMVVGDYFKFANHSKVYQVTDIWAKSFDFWPELVANVPAGTGVIMNNVPFEMRIAGSKADYSSAHGDNNSMRINMVEKI